MDVISSKMPTLVKAPEEKKEIASEEQIIRIMKAVVQENRGGKKVPWIERTAAFRKLCESNRLHSLVPLLPLVLNLNFKPYVLDDHFPFEAVFTVRMPRWMLLKTGRQVAKSTSSAARGVVLSNAIPNFSTLFVTPLYEQIRRFSTQYVRPFIDQSPIKNMWIGTSTENSVLQRTFKNNSRMFFSFAFTNADRIRGISAQCIAYDEVQDIQTDLIPVIHETCVASKWRLELFTGTPKTLDNTIQRLWEDSSQAEWAVPCYACNYLNIPAREHDLYKMIGPFSPDISEQRPATICAKCHRPIFPRAGKWIHKFGNRRWEAPGYHIPQIIMPMHYADKERWKELLGKQEGRNNTSPAAFNNEVLGESDDQGIKLVTKTDLLKAAVLPWRNDPLGKDTAMTDEPKRHLEDYIIRVLGVDWGGGGEKEISLTKMAVLGLRGDGKIDVIYGRQLLNPADQIGEGLEVLNTFRDFRCNYLAHDYNGAGSGREALLIHCGLPIENILPMVYHATATQNLMVYHKGEAKHSRDYWILDKARSLVLTCTMIKFLQIRFFQYDYQNKDNPGLLEDFLALMENKIDVAHGKDIYTIIRSAKKQDDFAHAVNFGACGIWHINGWPDLSSLANFRLSAQQVAMIAPPNPTWDNYEDTLGGFFNMP
jgi:hypothetical protein